MSSFSRGDPGGRQSSGVNSQVWTATQALEKKKKSKKNVAKGGSKGEKKEKMSTVHPCC